MVIKQGELALNLTERSSLGGESVWRNDGIDGDILLLVCASENTFSYREKKKKHTKPSLMYSSLKASIFYK